MVGGKRGFKFTTDELESLAESVKEFVPISGTEWEQVWNGHISIFPNRNRTTKSLKCIFQEMARGKIPTGESECPHHIRIAKRAYHSIVKATDGSTGDGSNDWEGGELGEEDKEEKEEKGEDNDDEISEGERNDYLGNDDDEGGTSLGVDLMNLFEQGGQDRGANADGYASNEILVVEEEGVQAVEGPAATASVMVASSTRRRVQVSVGGGGKRTKAFTQPLGIP